MPEMMKSGKFCNISTGIMQTSGWYNARSSLENTSYSMKKKKKSAFHYTVSQCPQKRYMFNMYFHLNTGSIYTRLTVWLIKDHDCKK
jgi:hypothetical protein